MKNPDLLDVKSRVILNYSKLVFIEGYQSDISKKMDLFKKSLIHLYNGKCNITIFQKYDEILLKQC